MTTLKNRHALLALGIWLVCLAAGTTLWLHTFGTYLLGQPFAVNIPVHQIIVALGCACTASLLLPIVPHVDALGTRRVGVEAAWLAAAHVVGWMLVPIVPAVIARVAPGLMPIGSWVDWSDSIETPAEILTVERVSTFVVTAVLLASLSLICAFAFGSVWGPLVVVGAWLGIVVAQSTTVGPWIPLGGVGTITDRGIGEEPFPFQPIGATLSLLTAVVAIVLWYRTRGVRKSQVLQ